MKRQGLPIWLLRDLPAFLGVMIGFWPLMILVITNGFRAMRGGRCRRSTFDDFPVLLEHAESRLDFAARFGLADSRRGAHLARPPTEDTTRRFQSYQRAARNLEACARAMSMSSASATASTSAISPPMVRGRAALRSSVEGLRSGRRSGRIGPGDQFEWRSARSAARHAHARRPPLNLKIANQPQPTSARPRPEIALPCAAQRSSPSWPAPSSAQRTLLTEISPLWLWPPASARSLPPSAGGRGNIHGFLDGDLIARFQRAAVGVWRTTMVALRPQ